MFYYILIESRGSNKGEKNPKKQKNFDFTSKGWWLIRSEKEIEFGPNGQLVLGVDGYCHFEYLYLYVLDSPVWTIGKFCGTRCIYKFVDELHVMEFLKQECDKKNEKNTKRLNKFVDAILQNI